MALLATRKPCRDTTRAGIRWSLDLREAVDISIYLTGYFQRRVIEQVLVNLPPEAATFIDVGCNRGAIAVPIALRRRDTRVIAIDPVGAMINRLRETLRLNPQVTNVELVCAFLSAPSGDSPQEVPSAIDASWNVFAEIRNPDTSCAVALTAGVSNPTTLDKLCGEKRVTRVDVIKIDVDGFELEVLKGAKDVLHRWSPVLVMEWATGSLLSRGCKPSDLSNYLAAQGYEPLKIRPFRKPTIVDWAELLKLAQGESCELVLRRSATLTASSRI